MIMKKKFIIVGVGSGIICFCIFLSSVIFILAHPFVDVAKKSDAIVALGRGVTEDGYPCTAERVRQAARLYKQGIAPVVIFAGGKLPVDYDVEAKVMKEIGLSEDVPEKSMLVEGKSHNTYEDLLYTKEILIKNNLHSMVIVSDQFHETRAGLIAKKLGISYTLSPATKSNCTQKFPQNLESLIHESLGIIYYKLRGRI
jgi:uncharacterized SAM-binding protein YcdF (DUF218 family)